METLLAGRVVLHCGDCRAVLAGLAADGIDAVVTDPPYHLTSQVATVRSAFPGRYAGTDGASRGFMGKQWDGGDVAFRSETWRAVYRVLKPGAHLVACGGTRTYHRMVCAIEDAGFEIRDTISWLYGSGFPKSHDVSKGIDRITATDAARQWEGWGTALKPACELIVLARKPSSEGTVAANVLRWGTGAINVDGCRVGTEVLPEQRAGQAQLGTFERSNMVTPERIGRWPANVVHDGSDEVTAAFPDSDGQQGDVTGSEPSECHSGVYSGPRAREAFSARNDSGSAARFFYTSKADADDRLGSKHPTVKPLDLMQWLVRLVTPKGGTVLDPFAGTGTTGEAAFREGMRAVLIEAEAEYQADIRRRMALVLAGPDERSRESVKAKGLPRDDGPLFASRETWADMWAKPFDFSQEPKGNPG